MSLDLKLNIQKPLVFLKVATTGFNPVEKKDNPNPADRIIEISIIKIDKERNVRQQTRLLNPGRPIPAEATAINGITDESVAQMPTFKEIAAPLYSFIGNSDIAGFSISDFDINFLIEEFAREGLDFSMIGRNVIDLGKIYNEMEKRDFRSALEKYTGRNLTDAAISSQTANLEAINILNGMVGTYSEDSRFKTLTASDLDKAFTRKGNNSLDIKGHIVLNAEGRPVFNGGKYKGKLIGEIMISDPGYYDWWVNVSDMPADTKSIIKKIVAKAKAVAASTAPTNQNA